MSKQPQAQKEATQEQKPKKKFNETITAMFNNERFGEGSYISRTLDKDVVIKAGNSILFKVTDKMSSTGNRVAFLEVLPPKEEKAPTEPSDLG